MTVSERVTSPRVQRAMKSAASAGLTLTYGPLDKLAGFFALAEEQMNRQGLALEFGSFDALATINAGNRQSWRSLIPSFDPAFCRLGPGNALCIFGRDASGEVVATQAVRLFSWTEMDFLEAAQSLRLFYDDPTRSKRPGEACVVTAEAMRTIKGRVCFSGAGWYRPEWRGLGLVELFCRYTRALAFTRWYTDYTACIMAEGVVKGGLNVKAGYKELHWDLQMIDSPVLPGKTIRAAALWMDTATMLADLEVALAKLTGSQVDTEVDHTRAHQHGLAKG